MLVRQTIVRIVYKSIGIFPTGKSYDNKKKTHARVCLGRTKPVLPYKVKMTEKWLNDFLNLKRTSWTQYTVFRKWPKPKCFLFPTDSGFSRLNLPSGNFFYRKSTIGSTITAIEANNDTYCLQKQIEKFPLWLFCLSVSHNYPKFTFNFTFSIFKLYFWCHV